MKNCWIKTEVLNSLIFPQYPYFCGIAACGNIANVLLENSFTQIDLHLFYGIGSKCKLKLPLDYDFTNADFSNLQPRGMGLSNWDIIRLFNSILLDHDMPPYSAILTGKDFADEMMHGSYANIGAWLQEPSNHAIIHLEDHYVSFAGSMCAGAVPSRFILCGDSSKFKGPVSSIKLEELIQLANSDQQYSRYGFILLSNKEIPLASLVQRVTLEMRPPESINCERFVRIKTK